ncbi:MAG: hypothetical protein JW891_16120 [Candidatus Lokiarchaeota archaeon]|nr:hypothetical protein [Candidatus Lokiarchaeota archaeon]
MIKKSNAPNPRMESSSRRIEDYTLQEIQYPHACVICHSLTCPTCGGSISGEDQCREDCPHCNYAYHRHCWEKTIQFMGKCALCLRDPLYQAKLKLSLRNALALIEEKAKKYERIMQELESPSITRYQSPIPSMDSERLISVFHYDRCDQKELEGFINGKIYLRRDLKKCGSLDGKTIDFGNEQHILRDDNTIFVRYKDDEEGKIWEAGYIQNNVIYARGMFYGINYDIIKTIFSKERGEFYDENGRLLLKLEGNLSALETIDYFGIACRFLEIFL